MDLYFESLVLSWFQGGGTLVTQKSTVRSGAAVRHPFSTLVKCILAEISSTAFVSIFLDDSLSLFVTEAADDRSFWDAHDGVLSLVHDGVLVNEDVIIGDNLLGVTATKRLFSSH